MTFLIFLQFYVITRVSTDFYTGYINSIHTLQIPKTVNGKETQILQLFFAELMLHKTSLNYTVGKNTRRYQIRKWNIQFLLMMSWPTDFHKDSPRSIVARLPIMSMTVMLLFSAMGRRLILNQTLSSSYVKLLNLAETIEVHVIITVITRRSVEHGTRALMVLG